MGLRRNTGNTFRSQSPNPLNIVDPGLEDYIKDPHERRRALSKRVKAEDVSAEPTSYAPDADNVQDVLDSIGSNPQAISVSLSGGDFTSIKEALDSITDNGPLTPYEVTVEAGVYYEDPMVVREYINLQSTGGARVVANDPDSPLFTMIDAVSIEGFNIIGPANNAAILVPAGSVNNIIEGNGISNSLYGVRITGIGAYAIVVLSFVSNDVTIGIQVDSGGRADCSIAKGFSQTFIKCEDAGSLAWLISGGAEFSTNVLYADNGGTIRAFNVIALNCTNILRANNSSRIEGGGIYVQGTSVNDIMQEDASSVITVSSGQMSSDRLSAVNWSNIGTYFRNTKEGDEGLAIIDELHVGIPEQGHEAAIGEGDSYTRGMLVYTYDGANYVDVSDAARSRSGSTFTFPNNNINTAIYVASSLQNGGDFIKHFGIKSIFQSAAVKGAGDIVAEYWDGAAWTEFATMSTGADSPYLPYGNAIFERAQDEQIRYNSNIQDDWTKNDDPGIGTDYFWVRFRITTAVITTAPVFEQWKVHSNRTEINGDGWQEFFGNARPLGVIQWDTGLFEPFQSSPGNQDLYVLNRAGTFEDLGRGGKENSFANGAVDMQGLCSYLPFDADTSVPIRLRFSFMAPSATGDVEWFVNFGFTSDGDTVANASGSAPGTIKGEGHLSQIVNIPAAITQQTIEFDIDVSEMVSRRSVGFGDLLWITISRDATAGNPDDTLAGSVAIIQINPIYTKWNVGGHIR